MRFDSYYEFTYFKKTALQNIKDKETKKQLEICDDNTIPDRLFYSLHDSLSSYFKEIKLFSSNKTFFQELLKDELIRENIVHLSSLFTHLSIGLTNRMKIRDNVDISSFMTLQEDISIMINDLIHLGKTKNLLIKYLKGS